MQAAIIVCSYSAGFILVNLINPAASLDPATFLPPPLHGPVS